MDDEALWAELADSSLVKVRGWRAARVKVFNTKR